MGFLSSKSISKSEPAVADKTPETPSARPDNVYADLIARRPGLLDEKLKLHERIIDEFNLTALEKMPPDELAKQVRTYVGDHVRRESLSLNQKELDLFSNEIIAEMTGYGPLEPLLKDPTVTDILINTHRALLHRALRAIAGDQGPFQGRGAPPAHHQPDRLGDRTARRRIVAHGRRAVARRLARQCRGQADRRRRAARFDPKIRRARPRHGAACRARDVAACDVGGSCGGGRGQGFDAHRRRHRIRQDDDAQRAVEFHSCPRTPDHHRGRRRTATATAPRRSAGDKAPPISKARAKSDSATSFAMR